MTELAVFVKLVSRCRLYHGGSYIGNVKRHLAQQFGVPGVASHHAAVEFLGDQFEDAFQAGVEAVQVERDRVQIRILVDGSSASVCQCR